MLEQFPDRGGLLGGLLLLFLAAGLRGADLLAGDGQVPSEQVALGGEPLDLVRQVGHPRRGGVSQLVRLGSIGLRLEPERPLLLPPGRLDAHRAVGNLLRLQVLREQNDQQQVE